MEIRIGVNLGEVLIEGDRIYGDGINVAARVQALAEGGGVCISGSVCDEIASKLTLECESLGEHTLKNIEEPVRVYRVRVGPTTGVESLPGAPSAAAGPRLEADARPSVAVLPFANMKNRAVKISDVGRELGVRYVLEGSVWRVGEQVRRLRVEGGLDRGAGSSAVVGPAPAISGIMRS